MTKHTSPTIKTTCPYCGVGCGVLATVQENNKVVIKGDPEHPANFGRLCSKGSALGETLDYAGRLLQPHINNRVTSWDQATQAVADGLSHIIKQHGPDAVAFYVSGQLLTEDYYVANKLMKGFIGSANIDTNSRLCMSSAVAAYKRAFGSDTVPCSYEDLEQADLIVITGSNLAWCHPVLYQRILQAGKTNEKQKVIVIDPRRSATCDTADLHLPIKPGSDAVLFNGLLKFLQQSGQHDLSYTQNHCDGVDQALAAAESFTPETVAELCELKLQDVLKFYQWFVDHEKTITLFSQGINQSTSGTDKGNAIINCHLLSGRIAKTGAGPFSITGQPNAMGGREVGGLANQLAAHMDLHNAEHRQLVQEFWNAPLIADHEGYKAVELFERIETGEVKAIWIMATNPVDSLPEADRVRRALQQCELVIVSDCMAQSDTVEVADIALPALAWGEKDGTVTNSERRISRQRAFLDSPADARPDWQIICDVAARMGFAEAFAYQSSRQIFSEFARLTAYHNNGKRDLDLTALTELNDEDYQAMTPQRWPCVSQSQPELFSDGQFFTANRRAQLISIIPRTPAVACGSDFPLLLNSGRSRDQWHTMTRSGKSARLSAHSVEPVISIHPETAKLYQVKNNSIVKISNANGELLARCHYDNAQRTHECFLPMHWSEQFAARARVGVLVNRHTDPYSGQPEFKQVPVNIKPFATCWSGFLLSKRRLKITQAAYWSRVKTRSGWLYHLADNVFADNWQSLARQWLCSNADSEWIEFTDHSSGYYRAARLNQGKVDSCLYLNYGAALLDDKQPDPQWLVELFNDEPLTPANRRAILSGAPATDSDDPGATVCACFSVGINQITRAIKQQKLMRVEQITEALNAGGNCGSCIPELRKILQQTAETEALVTI